jgi:hypothetical protein
VCTNTNLQLEYRLELYEAGILPWDIQMTVEESLSEDEVGVPHDVSDSESESENDSDQIYVSCDTEGIRLLFFNIWSSTLFLFLSSTFFFYI